MTQPRIPFPEERQYRRIPITYQVKVVTDDRIIVYSKAINLSLGGILVSGRDQLPEGSHCGVAILLVEGEPGRRVVARGTVVRTDQQGMAIAFSKALDPESEKSLRWLIRSLSPGAEDALPPPAEKKMEPPAESGDLVWTNRHPESTLASLMDRIKPGSARHLGTTEAWEPPAFEHYEDIRQWLKESVMSATMYERYPDGLWTIQLLLKEQIPGTYRYIVL
ncbi:MAG: PilZ domain-containing protein [Geothrix sp.]|nr:PilZ domain-containing protein [Geothrix sp.]